MTASSRGAVAFSASPAASGVTGQALTVDRGRAPNTTSVTSSATRADVAAH